jgi:hypothetical protein
MWMGSCGLSIDLSGGSSVLILWFCPCLFMFVLTSKTQYCLWWLTTSHRERRSAVVLVSGYEQVTRLEEEDVNARYEYRRSD